VAQEDHTSGAPAVFSILNGTWDGSGTLLGRPAEFQMAWELVGNGFVRLSFRNSWVTAGEEATPVLSAQAIYYFQGLSAVGVWIDDRPQRLSLEVAATDSSVIVNWTAEGEEGRTEYVIKSADDVLVRDFVYSNGTERLFGEAAYQRRPQSGQ